MQTINQTKANNMLQPSFTPFPVLTTDRLILRRMTTDDAPEMFFLRSDAEVLKYIDRAPAKTIADVVAFIEMIDKNLENNEGVNWAITLKDDPKLIGNICFWNIQKEHHRAEIGYVLHPDHQGKGLMQEAIRAAVDYGFTQMKLHSIEANIDPANTPSQKCLERTGFVREAYFRENYFYNGAFIDSAIYSLLTPLK